MITWDKCSDVMPDTVGEYLVCFEIMGHKYINIGYIEDDEFIIDDEMDRKVSVTHWSELNLPELEKEE